MLNHHLDPTVVAGIVTGIFALAGVALAQIVAERQQKRARRDATNDKIETATRELIHASATLQAAMAAQHAQWNTLDPRLKAVGRAFVEFEAGRSAGGVAEGMARAVRETSAWDERSVAAFHSLLNGQYERFSGALSRALFVPDKDVAVAVGRLGQAALDAMKAYGTVNLYRRKELKEAQEKANQALGDAVGNLTAVTRGRLYKPWWGRRSIAWIGRRFHRRAVPVDAASVPDANASNPRGSSRGPSATAL